VWAIKSDGVEHNPAFKAAGGHRFLIEREKSKDGFLVDCLDGLTSIEGFVLEDVFNKVLLSLKVIQKLFLTGANI